MFKFLVSVLTNPHGAWRGVAELPPESGDKGLMYPAVLALIPCVAWYFGVTQVGWSVGDGDVIKMTQDSALGMIIAFYFAMVGSLAVIGYFVHWMSDTYGAASTVTKGNRLAALSATPLFLSGIVGFHPNFLVDFTVGLITVSWSTYLLYVGLPYVMKIPEDRGFLFSSAVLAVCLVMLIVIMTASVILWDFGIAPAFTD